MWHGSVYVVGVKYVCMCVCMYVAGRSGPVGGGWNVAGRAVGRSVMIHWPP